MKTREWLAWSVVAVWVVQLLNLWPLPSEVAAQMATGARAEALAAVAQYESNLWFGWAIRAGAIPLGVASGILLLKGHRSWAAVLLVVSAACLALFQPWQWWQSLYAPLLGDSGAQRVSWLLGQPRLIFNTVVFPGVLLISAVV